MRYQENEARPCVLELPNDSPYLLTAEVRTMADDPVRGIRDRHYHVLAALASLALIPLVASGADRDRESVAAEGARILVLDNCDSDFKTPPFDDRVMLLTPDGKVANRIGGFNVCQQIGGARAVAASEDGRFFVVCEEVGNRITAYETSTGSKLWSVSRPENMTSAAVAGGLVYALESDGKIYGNGVVVIDSAGNIVRQAKVAGFDIAVDPNAGCLWLVGGDIKKCDMDLQVIWTKEVVQWCASSVDVNPDGSVWVTERKHPNVGGQNRLLKLSPRGHIAQSIPLDISPMCVRVDSSDGAVWVTGIYLRETTWPTLSLRRWPPFGKKVTYRFEGSRTYKYSAQGKLLFETKRGGYSLALDPSDGSAWIGGESKLLHCARNGTVLGAYGGVSGDQKWVAVVPAKQPTADQSPERTR